MASGPAQDDHWFVPKPVGYGAKPANAKGWMAIGIHLAVLAVLAIIGFVIGAVIGVVIFIVGVLAATAALIVVARRKTKGEWRWRSRSAGGSGAS